MSGRKKKRYACSLCGVKGHNVRSCPNRPSVTDQSSDDEVCSNGLSLASNGCKEVFCDTIILDDSIDEGSTFMVPQIPLRADHQIPGASGTVVPVVYDHLQNPVVSVCADDSIVAASQDSEFFEVEEINFQASFDSDQDSQLNVEVDRGQHHSPVIGDQEHAVAKCSYCKRQETPQYPLILSPVPDNYARRKFGDSSGFRDDSQVCDLCQQYITVAQKPSWAHAWPAVLYSSFVVNRVIRNKNHLVEFLPYSVREMWSDSVHSFLPEIQNCWETCLPKFADISEEIKAHKDHNEKLSLGGLMSLLNGDPFPVVRCPLGCYMFVDDLLRDKLELVPGCNYIACFAEGFSDFGADADTLAGRNPRWPEVVQELDWVVSPSIYIDPLKGLCFVQCSKSVHCSVQKKFVHVPLNPIGKYASLNVDITAPCVATTSFARHGRSNEHTSSYSVMKLKGRLGGISSFSVSPKRPVICNPSPVELLSWGLALSNRKDISSYLAASSSDEREWSKGVISTFVESAVPIEHVNECKRGSTFISVGDSMHYSKSAALKAPIQDEIDVQNVRYKGVQKEVLAVVHGNDGVGQNPYAIPPFQQRVQIEVTGCILRAVISCLLHCRELHRSFLHHIWRSPSGLLVKLRKILEAISSGKRKGIAHCQQVEQELVAAVLAADITLNEDAPVECLVSHILSFVCEVERVEVVAGFDINDFLVGQSGVYLFDSSNYRINSAGLSLVDRSGTYFLKLVCKATERRYALNDVSVAFRWLSSTGWIHSNCSKKFTVHDSPQLSEIGLFIYSSEKKERCLARDEFLNMSGGQEKVKCADHKKCALMKQHAVSGLICSYPACPTPIRWRCSNNFPLFEQCVVGLCLKHFHKSQRRRGEVYVFPRAGLPLEAIINEEEEPAPLGEVLEVVENAVDPLLNNYDFYVMDTSENCESIPVTSNIFDSAMYLSDLSDSTNNSSSGHYLLNNCLRVMSRVSVRGSAPVCLQRTLQSIYSRTPGHIVPLLYPEAVLFPKIFWAETDDAPLGALPSFLFSNQGVLGINNEFASMKDHLKIRLLDGTLLTSRDPFYISFAFDCELNQRMNYNSISVAMRKGLEFVNQAFVVPEDRENNLQFSQVDSRQKVNELSSFLKDIGHWTYFITLTCNDSATFGVAPIRCAIERAANNDHDQLELWLQNYCSIMCRSWERVVRHFMHFVLHSPEHLFGHVKGIWYRFEFQNEGSPGNKPHVHGGVTLHPETLNELRDLQRIACMVQVIFGDGKGSEFETLMADGIIKSMEEYIHLYSLFQKLQVHNCENSDMRCMKRTAEGDKKCRVPRHKSMFCYTKVEHQLYDEETLRALEWLDLAEKVGDREWKLNGHIQGCRWSYPTTPGITEVPTVPRLFFAFRSVTNVQYCDKKFHTAYLVKYCAGSDEKRDVVFKKKTDKPEIIAEARQLYNAKISGSAFSEKQARKEMDEPLAREVCLPEMLWFTLGLPFVHANVEFVNVSTLPPEYRANVKKCNTRAPAKLVNPDGSIKSVASRQNLPLWRQYSRDQLVHIDEYCKGNYILDRTGHFSVRPPELFLIRQLAMYCRWFVWDNVWKQSVAGELSVHCLLDGAGYRVRVRLFHLHDVVSFFETFCNDANAAVRERATAMHELYSELAAAVINGDETSQFVRRFVNVDKRLAAVVVQTPVTPEKMDKFLYHLILTLGKFDTEVGLSRNPSFLEAFRDAQVLGAYPRGHADAKDVIRRYVLEQLVFLPVSSREFARMLAVLIEYLKKFFADGVIVYDGMPLVTSRSINEAASTELRHLEELRLDNLITALEGQRLPHFPGRVVLEHGDPAYNPVIVQIPGQIDASYVEQCKVLTACLQAINNYGDVLYNYVQSIVLLGPPGSGKTHVLLIACVYALSRKLNVAVTALTSERARMLGGEHLHLLLSIPVEQGSLQGAAVLAEKCLLRLAANPVKFAYLRRLDVIFVEEIGMLPAKLVAVLDLVLQRIKSSAVPFGGVLLICSGDSRQLAPIGNLPIWTSGLMFTVFRTFVLKHFVRSRQDQDLQLLISLMRQPYLSVDDVGLALQIIRNRCVPLQFVPNWDAVPLNVLRVVGKKKAEQEAIKQYLTEKKQIPGLQWQEHLAADEVEATPGQWRVADESVSRMIQRQVTEESKLLLYEGAVMRLTYNNVSGTVGRPVFSQGQISVVKELPDITKPRADQRMKVVLIPPGCRDFDPANLPPQWPLCTLVRRSGAPVVIGRGNLKGRRDQWPVRYFVAYTVHKIIGDTCSRLATQISLSNTMYRLWEREQLLVIISRVTSLDDITFVGTVEDTFSAMTNLLKMRSQATEHINEVVTALDEMNKECVISNYFCVPSHETVDVPTSRCGFVYIVRSVRNVSLWRIEEAVCIKEALRKLNKCSFHIDSSLRPWMLVAFICGFPFHGVRDQIDENKVEREEVLGLLKTANSQHAHDSGVTEIQCSKACNLGKEVVKEYNRTHQDCRLVWRQCFVFGQTDAIRNVRNAPAVGNNRGLGNLRIRLNRLQERAGTSSSS